jgi:large subunit ribosomal protein L5
MPQARLKRRYEDEIRPELIRRFGYSTPMQAPVIQKITLNMGVGDAKQDSKALDAATEQLATIAGQRPNVRRARKSVAAFKLREGMPVGISVTLRGERGYEFLDRLMSIAIPRIRDFRGMNPRSFDGRGNYSMGVREQIIFPEIDYDSIDQTRGMDITITTSARNDLEAFTLLELLGFPFSPEGRPAGAEPANGAAAAAAAPPEFEPVVEEPVNGAAASEAPPESEPAVEEPANGAAAADAPPEPEPAVEEPAAEAAAAVEDPAGEVVEEAPAESAQEPVAEEPAAEVAVEEPAGEVVEEAPVESAQEPVAEESAAEVAVEEPAGEAVDEAPVEFAQEPVAEEPAAEQADESATEPSSQESPSDDSETSQE